MLLEEESLINRAKQGEAEAFGKLYDQYAAKIYRFILIKTGRKADAEDLTSQVFLKAWESIHGFEFQGFPFSSWLYRIAGNSVIDYYRTFHSHQDVEEVAEAIQSSEDHISELDLRADTKKIQSAIRNLDPDQQTVILMRFVDELSTKEIASAIGKSEGAIRVIQHRALKNLRQLIDHHESR
jgi:RNA polymerase sigma-70 factor (ECF subfamily)